jgi:hypothetical protein
LTNANRPIQTNQSRSVGANTLTNTPTNHRTFLATVAAGLAANSCANMPGAGCTTLVDGAAIANLNGFTALGAGGWSITDGALPGPQ